RPAAIGTARNRLSIVLVPPARSRSTPPNVGSRRRIPRSGRDAIALSDPFRHAWPVVARGERASMALLTGFRVTQIGDGLAAAVAGRLFADAGAAVICIGATRDTPLAEYLNHGKAEGGTEA